MAGLGRKAAEKAEKIVAEPEVDVNEMACEELAKEVVEEIEQLEEELKELIISTLALEDVTPGDIPSDQILFGEGLGLDSVDALELGVALQKNEIFFPKIVLSPITSPSWS